MSAALGAFAPGANRGQVLRNTTGLPTLGNQAPSVAAGAPNTPDYNALINSDPGLVAYRGSESQNLGDLTAQRTAAIRALAVQYGGALPAGADKFGDVDAQTAAASAANPYSTVAQDQRSYGQGVNQLRSSLAARGILQSGELANGLNQANYGLGLQRYNDSNAFNSALQGALGTYTGGVNTAKTGEANAVQTAAQNVYADPLARPALGAPSTIPANQSRISVPGVVSGTFPAPRAAAAVAGFGGRAI